MRRFSALALLAIACGQPGGGDADLTGPATATLADPTVDAPLTHEVRVASSAGEYTLDLVRNDRLFADGYRATVVEPGGVVRELPFAETPAARPCYYLGTVRDPSGAAVGRAAVSTCLGGVRGLVEVSGALYDLDATDAVGALRRIEATTPDDVHNLTGAYLNPTVRGDLDQRPPPALRTVELHTWADQTVVAARGAAGALTDDAERANVAQLAYGDSSFTVPILVTLVAQTALTVNPFPFSPVGFEIDTGELLNDFLFFAAGQPTVADAWSFTTAADFNGATVGLAPVGAICSNSSGFVIQAFATVPVEGITLAHELGHVLGMFHDSDGNPCPSSGFVMSPFIDPFSPASTFSACSDAYVEFAIDQLGVTCLDDAGDPPIGGSGCGDGVVDVGEQCDCGPFDCAVVDPCCDGATCQLTAGATCSAADGCCDPATCDPASAGATCRDAADPSCDLAETCDGTSSICPADVAAPAGTTCASDGFPGACYEGDCVSLGEQCDSLGPIFGGDFLSTATCDPFNDTCGDLVCGLSPSDPGFCIVFGTGSGNVQVDDGTLCGAGQQCFEGNCVDSETLNPPSGDDCPADPLKTTPGICGCGVPDTDGDGDGTADCLDACPADPAKTDPGTCGCGTSDADADGDGAPTCLDACPADPSKTAPGTCGCGFSDGDADGDGAVDCLDACPADAAKTDPGTCGCGAADVDVDPGPAFVCPGCGNGVLEAGEACDGGDVSSGDGCSSTCEVEPLALAAPVPGTAGVVNAWSLTGTRPGATITMLASLRAGTTAVPLCPGLTVPIRDVVIIGTTIGGDDGTASFTLTPPTSIAGKVVRFVAVDQALCEASPMVADTL